MRVPYAIEFYVKILITMAAFLGFVFTIMLFYAPGDLIEFVEIFEEVRHNSDLEEDADYNTEDGFDDGEVIDITPQTNKGQLVISSATTPRGES